MLDTKNTTPAAQQVVEQAFLSPRVVDAATLAEFAASLRGLLEGAAVQRELLQSAVAAGETIAETLAATTAKASEKLRPVVKLLPTIDQKLAKAEEVLSQATKTARSAERAADKVAKTAAEQVKQSVELAADKAAKAATEQAARAAALAADNAINAVAEKAVKAAKAATKQGTSALREAQGKLKTALEQAQQLEAKFGELTQRAEMAVEVLDKECKERVDGAAGHAQDVLGMMIAEIDARAAEAIGRVTTLIVNRQAEAEAAIAEAAKGDAKPGKKTKAPAKTRGSAAAAETAATEACAGLETLVESIKSRATTMGDSLDKRVNNATRRAKAAIERAKTATERAGKAEKLAAAAEARLAATQEHLQAVDERGREIETAVSHALAAFDEELAARMQTVREMMEQLASVTGGKAGAAGPATQQQPGSTAEVKPVGGPTGFVRIDRPMGSEAPSGLPGHLRF